jgi:hypothetical protein
VVTLAQCERAFADERVGLAIFILSVGHAVAAASLEGGEGGKEEEELRPCESCF